MKQGSLAVEVERVTAGTSVPDRGLVERLTAMNAAAFQLAARVLGTAEGAEDVVQQSYVAAFEQLRRGARVSRERSWFLRAVANTARNHLKLESRRRRREGAMEIAAAAAPPDAELVAELRSAMAALEGEERVAVALCCEQGLSRGEAAEVLDLPERTVSNHVSAGLERLRVELSRAGYAAAGLAGLSAALAHTAPIAPVALAAKVQALAAQALTMSVASSAAAAGKAGLAMKVVAGIVLAGALAGTVAVVTGVGAQHAAPLQSPPAAAAEAKDPPEDQKYSMRILVWNFWSAAGGILDGAAGQAESADLIKGHDVDNAGNVYWTECDAPVIRRYSPKTDRVETIAGSIRGFADGPLNRARFGGWSYNSTNLICVSGDGKHLFVRDAFGKGQWRYVDLEAGTVTSLGLWHHYPKGGFGGGYFIIARDRMGDVYAFITDGQNPPDCKGYKKLKVAPLKKEAWYGWDRYALDVEKMKLYFHCRGPVNVYDLKTGDIACLTAPDNKVRPINTSGPLETTTFLCPTGMALSPAGRYLYVGQGDGSSCFRLDLEKKQALAWGGLDGGGFGWRDTANRKCDMTGCTGWPAATNFIPDGRGFWANCWGLYALTPMKGGN